MAANTFAGGTGDAVVTFDKPVDHLNVYVATGVTFAISLDKGENFLTLPDDWLHSFKVGPIKEVHIQADGIWQLIGVQA